MHNLVERVGRVDEHVQRELALHILRVGLTVRVTRRVVVQVGLARPEAAVVRLGVVLRTGVIVVEGEQVVQQRGARRRLFYRRFFLGLLFLTSRRCFGF